MLLHFWKDLTSLSKDLKDYVDTAATGVIKEHVSSAEYDERSQHSGAWSEQVNARPYRRDQSFEKVCAKFLGGVKWGAGLQMERTCRTEECGKCSGSPLERQCRFFTFRPHYTVKTVSGASTLHETVIFLVRLCNPVRTTS